MYFLVELLFADKITANKKEIISSIRTQVKTVTEKDIPC
jgi:hypothetical protein